MQRHNIEFLWGWFDARRHCDTASMAALLDPGIAWQGVRSESLRNAPQLPIRPLAWEPTEE